MLSTRLASYSVSLMIRLCIRNCFPYLKFTTLPMLSKSLQKTHGRGPQTEISFVERHSTYRSCSPVSHDALVEMDGRCRGQGDPGVCPMSQRAYDESRLHVSCSLQEEKLTYQEGRRVYIGTRGISLSWRYSMAPLGSSLHCKRSSADSFTRLPVL